MLVKNAFRPLYVATIYGLFKVRNPGMGVWAINLNKHFMCFFNLRAIPKGSTEDL
jgi:hypothetical protein